MPIVVPYASKKPDVIRVIEEHAKGRKKLTYGDLGKLVGIPSQGPWKALLDEVSKDYTGRGLPDITHLVVGSGTGYPHQIDFEDARTPTAAQKAKADHIIESVFNHYASHAE